MALGSQHWSNSPIVFSTGKASAAELAGHLRACDESFVRDLSQRVNIEEYAAKIKAHAVIFEGWQDEKLVGTLAAYYNKDTLICFITNVSVLPTLNNKGIGKQLLDLCLNFAENHNFEKIRLEVSRNNAAALSFYTKNGFDIVERQETFFIMELKTAKL